MMLSDVCCVYLTYCSAQLTRTLNCKHRLQYIMALALGYALCGTCTYSYGSLPGISLRGTNVLGNICSLERKSSLKICSRERKFPGTLVFGSERFRRAKIPESEKSPNLPKIIKNVLQQRRFAFPESAELL